MTAGIVPFHDLGSLQNTGALTRTLRGRVTFAAGTTGAIAQHTIFTVTGLVQFALYVYCVSDLTSGGAATISIGNAGAVGDLLIATLATDIDAGDYLAGNVGDLSTNAAGFGAGVEQIGAVSGGADITADILAATITGGVLEYTLVYSHRSSNAAVALGAELVAI